MISLLTSLWRSRWLRVVAWAVLLLFTLCVLLCQWVNWLGAHRWRAAQEKLARAGETVEFRKIAPEAVPDEQNFCAIPLLKNLALDHGPEAAQAEGNRKRLESLSLPRGGATGPKLPAAGYFTKPTDLTAWADWLRQDGSLPTPQASGVSARDVLAALSPHDAVVGELVAGLGREQSQWTPPWRHRELPGLIFTVTLPHYKASRAASPLLALRAIASAHAGEASQAHEALLVLLRLSRASLEDPLLIGSLVGMSHSMQACGVTWEFCRMHAGTTEDFQRLARELRKIDMRAVLLRAFRGELAGAASGLVWLKESRDMATLSAIFPSSAGGLESLLQRLCPDGWFDMNAATLVEWNLHYNIAPLRDEGLLACINRWPGLEKLIRTQREHPYLHLDTMFAVLALPATRQVCTHAAFVQDVTNQAIVACALEQHFLAHAAYPETLAALRSVDGTPLPTDVITGRPMRYRKTPDGRYLLWSPGIDGDDDGGTRVLDEKLGQRSKLDAAGYKGDWVWDFPSE